MRTGISTVALASIVIAGAFVATPPAFATTCEDQAPHAFAPMILLYVECEAPLEVVGTPEPEPEPETYRVWLGVDCTKPHMVDLPCNVLYECSPDDVLTECEAE